jgi:hypothetical protein
VLPASSRGPPGGRRATGAEADRCGSARRGGGGDSVRRRAAGSSSDGGLVVTSASSWSYEGG